MEEKEFMDNGCRLYNEKVGGLKYLDCPICRNKGKVMLIKYDEQSKMYLQYVKDCECMTQRKLLETASDSGLGEYLKKDFDDYIATDDWQKEIKHKAQDYCKVEDDSWYVALGQSGSGKTLICSIIANYEMSHNKKKVFYITWTDFIAKVKRDMMGDNTEEVGEYINQVKNVEVLFIDELLKKYNETDLKYIIEIINYRYTNNLKTIITSEKMVGELLDIDEATMSRVIEKAGAFIFNIAKDRSKNYRLRGI